MKQLRILMVGDLLFPDVQGGSGRVIMEVSKHLVMRGHQVTVLTRRLSQELPAKETISGVSIYRHDVNCRDAAFFFFSSLRNMRTIVNTLLHNEEFDCILLHQPLSALGVLCTAKAKHIPKTYVFHSSWPQEYQVRNNKKGLGKFVRFLIERYVLARVKRIIVLSKFSKQTVSALYPDISCDTVIIPGGVDVDRFTPVHDRRSIREKLGIPDDSFVFLTVRQLNRRMGLENLLAAMSEVVSSNQKVSLIIGGSGPLEAQLKKQAGELGLEHYVIFAGRINDESLPLYYQAADIFVLPTKSLEGFGLVTLEALACGTPVLGTPVGGTVEILKALNEKFLFPGTESCDIAKLMIEFSIKEPSELNELRKQCREFVVTNYSWKKASAFYEAVVMNERIKVLHVHTLPVVSGSGINTLLTMAGLEASRYAVEFACAPGGPLEDEVKKYGIPYRPIRNFVQEVSLVDDIRALTQMVRLLKKGRYDIVHTHNSKAGFIGRLAGKITRVPVIVHTVHGFSFHGFERPIRRRLFIMLERAAARWADKLITVSEPLRNWGLTLKIGRKSQYVTIYDGIAVKEFSSGSDSAAMKESLGVPADELVVGLVAKLWEGKGHECLLRAAQSIVKEIPKVKFLFVGEGYLRAHLEKTVRELGLSDKVIFTGFRTDIPAITAAFDVAVLPSFFEGLGRSILEAMAAAKPVVASRVGGIVDIVDDTKTGFLVAPDKPDELAASLMGLLLDKELRVQMGRRGREKIDEKFTIENMVFQIQNIYEEYIARKRLIKEK